MCQYTDRKPFNWHIVELVYWHIIKKQPAYKPGSVLPFARERLSFISTLCHHRALAVYPPASGEQPYNAGIHNLTTHKTYGTLHCCKAR